MFLISFFPKPSCSLRAASRRPESFLTPGKVEIFPGSFSKWWTVVTAGMYIALNLSQKLKETLLGKR
jgi:hypothetical protein